MSKDEKTRFLQVLKDIKLPEGFSSNISRQVQVKEHKIVGLKSHDCHVLMQQLLPLAMRGSLSTQVSTVLNEYCTFFRELCGKVVDVKTLELLEMEIPMILCKLTENILEEIICLARGPKHNVASYHDFFVNGYKFRTIIVDHLRVTQNSGVASIREAKKIFYGVVENVLEVYFGTLAPVHLLKCSWYDMKEGRGRVVDEYNFTLVNTTKKSFEDEPFIYPSQAQQVFYSKDPIKIGWSVVCRWKPIDTYDIPTLPTDEVVTSDKAVMPSENSGGTRVEFMDDVDDNALWLRKELGTSVRENAAKSHKHARDTIYSSGGATRNRRIILLGMAEGKRKYDFVDSEKKVVCDDMAIEAMKPLVQKYLKKWRAYLKKNCFKKVAEKDISGSPNTRVTDEEWDNIVKYWKNEDNIKVAQTNKQNRSHAQGTHTLGTRAIARHYNDERQKKGRNFDILESYVSAHHCKKGGNVCTWAEVVEKFRGIEGIDPTDPRALSSVLDKVYKSRHGGYERGLGTGWSRRKHNVGATSSRNENDQLFSQLEEALLVISQLKESDQEKSAHMIQMEK
ncbi:hypothetical protein H6P81_010288 [Aristolochia fimbriata]|uniref:DUF4216 domain-containing protein n=1 Tax=Aristolochia fimbriata TaxID=158543 RepID=A0AAV7ENC0_ARIFI|nr:hypothetical protein H6P81_010288 [Aristolochia fimbriata]